MMLTINKFNFFFSSVFLYSGEFFFFKKYKIINFINMFKTSIFSQLLLLVEMACVDNLGSKNSFKLSYIFQSYFLKLSFVFVISCLFFEKFVSLFSLYKSSIWLESEVFDMFGMMFLNNPDLSKILTDYTFFGHPLSKDFPLTGYFELSFSEKNFMIQEKVCELMQEYSFFQVTSSMEDWDLLDSNI